MTYADLVEWEWGRPKVSDGGDLWFWGQSYDYLGVTAGSTETKTFTTDSVLVSRNTKTFTADTVVSVGPPAIVSPKDGSSEQTSVYLVFTSSSKGNYRKHFKLELDKTSNAFEDLELDLNSATDQTNWEYDASGAGDWTALPSTGLDSAYFGNDVRYHATLTSGSKWWRVRESNLQV